ncbi:hypothetical protein HW555_001289 [Spodoptera exigua]|uniref:Acyl-coenzyme A oxidase n=1 Tax=Spodoptera exigua TaxID=7107 RepID=A0A835GRR1_SPOEX|nr:hypothetical protein HW555_001289 [Spodoptera exigua]
MSQLEKMKVNPDLAMERAKCNFNIMEVTHILDGGEDNTLRRKKIEDIALNSGASKDSFPEEHMSPKEKYENAVRKSCLYADLVKNHFAHLTGLETFGINSGVIRRTADAFFKEVSPFLLHMGMFVPTIMGQCTSEQMSYWLPRAMDMQIIGTYAQTELGHGTFIRGLETTATYDPETEEFVLHSPTLSSYKWWAGGLGNTANYCIVVAQLYTKGECHGTHPFIVQIRDEDTHMPLPGITVGEIGPKMGFNTADNGFLGFDHYRIPREHMMMKNAQVLKDGTYVKVARHGKLTYGTMVFVRVILVNEAAFNLAKACTIAVRYSAIRRQSRPNPDAPEPQILDYATQQHKLFITIATAHALQLSSTWLWQSFSAVLREMKDGNTDKLPEFHALSSCLKAVSTSDAAYLIEQCRHACGGHGYMISSGIPHLYNFVSATRTYEGDYTVLLLQTARFLVKAYEQAEANQPLTPTVSYLKLAFSRKEPWDSSPAGIVRSFQALAAGKLSSCVKNMRKRMRSGLSEVDAWESSTIQLVSAAEAHCRAVISDAYRSEIVRLTANSSPNVKIVMEQLSTLYLYYWALERTGDLLLYTSMSEKDIVELQLAYEEQLQKIRPNAVGIVEAFDLRDELLHSTLGSYDGQAYERLMDEALRSPMNKEPVNQAYYNSVNSIVASPQTTHSIFVIVKMSAKVNEDLLTERKKCDFNVEELTNYLDGGAQATENRRKLEDKVLSTKGLLDEVPEEYLSHKEKYENAVRKAVVYYKAMKEAENPNMTEEERANATYRSLLHAAVFKDNSPFSLHLAMFIPAILGQADEEQKKYWMKRASKMEIIGTYAQTELGHGTFIRGLETTATYDPHTEEFVLHSPTLTAYKWWPGSLAHTANYCVVMAHLYINGKSCGIQPFIVQLRDEETHQPLPGIKLGEIGAKLGFNTVNNGFLGFDQHRIPRNRMLMKNAQILDYVTQQHKLFIGIASSHAFSLTAKWLTRMYQKVTADLEKGNLDELPELHAIACCLKAVTTSDTSVLVERSRTSCGGHGSLVKAWELAQSGKPLSPTMSYLSEKISHKQKWENSVDGIVKGFQRVAYGKVQSAVNSIRKYVRRGLAPEDAWNMSSVQLVAASEAHCRAFILSTYKSEVERTASTLSAPLKKVLNHLVELYAIYWALERVGDLLLIYPVITVPFI